jgi:hypothetical protein
MRIVRFALALALAAAPAIVSASDQATPSKDKATAAAPASEQFAALKGIKAVPMSSSELKAVKGQHVHFLVNSQNDQFGVTGLHLAGDIKTENNWENLGGTDPAPVAPSYHGLCVASGTGTSPIFIPFNPAAGTQCP